MGRVRVRVRVKVRVRVRVRVVYGTQPTHQRPVMRSAGLGGGRSGTMSSEGREKERRSRRRESMSDSTILGDPACSLELERHLLLVWIRIE